MTFEMIAQTLLVLVGFGVTIWLIKRDLTKISNRMDCFEKSQHHCQLDIAKEYVTKADLRRVEDQCDRNTEEIATLKGKNGS